MTGPLKVAKRRFPGRALHQHNAAITVVRTAAEEMEILARVLADNCNEATGAWNILVPMGGFSAFDSPNGPLPDPAARERFLKTLQGELKDPAMLQTLPCHVNDPAFAEAVIGAIDRVMALV